MSDEGAKTDRGEGINGEDRDGVPMAFPESQVRSDENDCESDEEKLDPGGG